MQYSSGASLVHCGNSLMTSARRWLKRASNSSAVITAPLVDSRLPCVTTAAGDVAISALAEGTTSTPTLSNGMACSPGRVRNDDPVVASFFSPACASVARRSRLMRLCDAFRSVWGRIGPCDVVAGTTAGQRSFGLRYGDTRCPCELLPALPALTMVLGVALARALASSSAAIRVRRAHVVRVHRVSV
eukprot:2417236-Pleurochrysis_carterae.AAC.1